MLARFMGTEAAIVAVSKKMRGNKYDMDMLSDSDMESLEADISLLKPIHSITTVLCDVETLNVPLILPFKVRHI